MTEVAQLSWPQVPLGEVVTLHYGKALDKQDRDPNGAVPVYGANGIKDRSNKSLTSGPSLVVGRKGSAGEITRVDGLFWPLDVSYYTSHDPDRLDFNFLEYALKTLDLPSMARGVKPGINRNDVYALPIPLPTLDEQKRIVAVLDQAFAALDRVRAHAEANLADAQELFDAWLTAVFHNHPATWNTSKLKELCDRVTVGHVGPMATRYKSEGITFLRSQNVRPFRISLEDVKFIDEDFHSELRKSELHPGDVAIVRTGYPGTAAVIPDTLTVANCSDVVIARPKSVLSPDFLVMFLNSSFGKNVVAAKAVGAAQKHFNVGAAKEVDFAYPDTKQQNRLIEKSKLVRAQSDKLKAVYLTKLADIADLRQSLLQKAFSGELV